MLILVVLFMLLFPFSVSADSSWMNQSPSQQTAPQGWNVIPDGQGGVTYWRGQGGTDAYTAGLIGQGLAKMSTPPPRPRYDPPPFTLPSSFTQRCPYDCPLPR